MRSFALLLLLLLSLLSAPAWAGVDGAGVHSTEGDAIAHEFNSTTAGWLLYHIVLGAESDTGNEVCAARGMDCVLTYELTPSDPGHDELTVRACTDDVPDFATTLVGCN